MNDTSEIVKARYEALIMSRSLEERVKMGCDMFEAAKVIARSSIIDKNPHDSISKIKGKIFIRFYGQEFLHGVQQKILSVL